MKFKKIIKIIRAGDTETRFRRECNDESPWLSYNGVNIVYNSEEFLGSNRVYLGGDDYIADDWIIKRNI